MRCAINKLGQFSLDNEQITIPNAIIGFKHIRPTIFHIVTFEMSHNGWFALIQLLKKLGAEQHHEHLPEID